MTSHEAFFTSPTVQLRSVFPQTQVQIYAKLDNLQMTGSTKERTAYSLLEGLTQAGQLARGGTVIESTSGNLGMALARQCVLRGVQFIAVVDERANKAATAVMAAYGATVDLVPTPPDGNRLRARVARVRHLLDSVPGSVTTNQYSNENNPTAHASSTFPEVCEAIGGFPDRIFVATSTAGTLLGCLRAVDSAQAPTQVVAVDSEGSALFGGDIAERYLPGLGAGFETDLSLQAKPHVVRRIPEVEMVRGARILARREGILAGASTGALIAALGWDLAHVDRDLVACQKWVFLVHDGGQPYLPTVYDDTFVDTTFGYSTEKDATFGSPNPFEHLAVPQ